jgi:hypothetical protein
MVLLELPVQVVQVELQVQAAVLVQVEHLD